MPKVLITIFADLVRMESTGKLIMVGVYSGRMLTSRFPTQGGIQPSIIVDDLEPGANVKIEVRSAAGAVFAEFEAEAEAGGDYWPGAQAWLNVPQVPFTLSEPDEIEVYVTFDGEDAVLAGSLPVALRSEVQEIAMDE